MSGRTGVFSVGMCPRCGATARHEYHVENYKRRGE